MAVRPAASSTRLQSPERTAITETSFEFLRNDVLNARDWFLPPDQPQQNFKRNVFGGTVGGPIKKDKTFFFLAYQGTRRREGQNSGLLHVLSDP